MLSSTFTLPRLTILSIFICNAQTEHSLKEPASLAASLAKIFNKDLTQSVSALSMG